MAPYLGSSVDITDIRQGESGSSLLDEIRKQLRPKQGSEKTLPTLLLYDEPGLKLFEDITYLEEYYLTNAEIEVLKQHAFDIAQSITEGSLVVELGSGNLRKIRILLEAIDKSGKHIDYYALDLSLNELKRTFTALPRGAFRNINCHALLGTYEDGLTWLQQPENRQRPCAVLSMGSSIGNFDRDEAAAFLANYARILRPGDLMLIALDACQDENRVFHAYNDRQGKTYEFYRNGLVHINALYGQDVFREGNWSVVGRYNSDKQCHQAFYEAKYDHTIDGIDIKAGEWIRIEESYKYSSSQQRKLWQNAGLVPQAVFINRSGEYDISILSVPAMAFPTEPKDYAAGPVPSLSEYEHLWSAWDTVSRQMLPAGELLSKPIKLRNCCLFYLGHIPTFLDMHMARATDGRASEPSFYWKIFERGIDPDVENPEQCHAHSEIPEEWPPVEQILEYQERVRNRVRSVYANQTAVTSRMAGRALWIGLEHEAMHLETLLYMLVQSDKVLPPPGIAPNFEALAKQAARDAVANEWIKVPARTIFLGMDDPENDEGPDRFFGWDNEKPRRAASVPTFLAKARPITNQEYARYLEKTNQQRIPASWALSEIGHINSKTITNGVNSASRNGILTNGHGTAVESNYLEDKTVRTVFGLVPLKYALDWPVLASYDELSGCARWMNGRIPTAEEAQSIYSYADELKTKEAEKVQSETISAVNGHLSNDGVEESPPSHSCRNDASSTDLAPDPYQLFSDLKRCNVGFQHFHPTPVTHKGNTLSGRSDMGGAWEWTSSVLEEHEGFRAMGLYPAYTADFFDGKHNVVLGGSWATHPRIAGRRSFVNWYQRNYPYVWATARMVRDT